MVARQTSTAVVYLKQLTENLEAVGSSPTQDAFFFFWFWGRGEEGCRHDKIYLFAQR